MKSNPRPAAHEAIKKYINRNLDDVFKELDSKLKKLRLQAVDETYQAFQDEIDIAIEEAYNEGIEDGKKIGYTDGTIDARKKQKIFVGNSRIIDK